MMERQRMYEVFAGLLAYPTQERDSGVGLPAMPEPNQQAGILDWGVDPQSDVGAHLSGFVSATEALSSTDMEELYTRTFDINPIASLEIGWHLYGEAYERGAFLVTMRELLRQHGVPESAELPDHLVHVLQLLGRMDDAERDAFSSMFLFPALKKMLEGFEKQSTPYEHVLRALLLFLKQRHLQGVQDV